MIIFNYKTAKQSFNINFRIKPKSAKCIKETTKKNCKYGNMKYENMENG